MMRHLEMPVFIKINVFYKEILETLRLSRARLQLRRASGNFYFKIRRFLLKIVDF